MKPHEIEQQSFAIIDAEAGHHDFPSSQWRIVQRVIHTSADFESFERNENKAFPHQKTENGYSAVRLNDRYYSTAPAAGINASISDMGQFLIAVSTKDDNLLSEKARKIIFTPQVETPLRRTYYRNWDNIDSKQYAIGWRIVNYKDHIVANHGGYVSGYQSEIAICEEEELGIVILTNSPFKM